ncbi:complement receptor type 1 [Ciona intestinalis]
MNCTDGNAVGSTCTFTCNDEYLLTGSPTSRCVSQPNGDPTFTHPEPVCERIQCSDPPPAPANGQMQCSDGTNIGSQCTYTCDPDYAVVGPPVTTCRNMGDGYRFDNPAPVCQLKTCQPPYETLQNGQVSCTNQNAINSRCSFTCNPEYELVGEAILTCDDDSDGDANGQWSSDPPSCTRIQCSDPSPAPADGQRQCSDGNNIGSQCTYTCAPDFAVVGPPVTTCRNMGDGYRFDNPAPVCQLKTCQPSYTTLENGEVDCTNSNAIHSQCTFSCGPDYELVGNPVLTCNDDSDGDPNGQWSSDAPSCRRIQCSPPQPPPANGAINCSRGNNIGSQCTYTCGPDFAVVGPSVTTCRDMGDGDYRFDNPAPVCQLITCQPPFNNLQNGDVTCTETNIVNSECTFTCEPGYELVGAEVLTCNDDSDGDANGQWSDTEPFCRRMQCTLPPDPMNGFKVCSGGQFLGAHCEFSCNPGYSLVGAQSADCSETQERSLSFDNPPPTCELKTCQPRYDVLLNGQVSCTNQNAINSRCSFTCNPEYELVGEAILTCNDDSDGDPNGQWSSDPPSCTRIQCSDPPPAPANGQMQCSDGTNIGSQCTYTCSPDYAVVGDSVTTCRDMGNGDYRFDNPAPVCQLKTCQPRYDVLLNGQVSCTNQNAINSRCSFTCNTEYELVGEAILTCNDDSDGDANGQWSSDAPSCSRIQCSDPPPAPANGQMQCSDGNNIGSQCTYTCSPDYAVVGDSVTTCTDMGNGNYRFDNPAPVCQLKTCQPRYDVLLNGQVSCTNQNAINSRCSFTCNPEYELVGEAILTCNDDSDGDANGQWSSDAPSCTRIQCSDPPPAPANGQMQCSDGTNIGSQCTYTCTSDYAVVGDSVTTCRDMGNGNYRFDNPAPVCQLKTCQPPYDSLQNGQVSCTNQNAINSRCSFTCNPEYELVGEAILTCNDDSDGDANGQWSSDAPSCRRIQCSDPPPAPANGQMQCSDGTNIGSQCTYTCDPDFAVVGPPVTTCRNMGNGDYRFDNPAPVCDVKTCQPSYETLENGEVDCTNSNVIHSRCSFTCNPEYDLVGEAILTCNDDSDGDPNGQWSSDAPSCRRKQCGPPPPAPDNGQMQCSDGINLGSQCTYTCSPDYAVVGNPVSTCTDMGNGNYRFDNPPPVCQIKTCQPPYDTITPSNGDVNCTNSNVIHSQCTFTCHIGFELVGTAVLTCNDGDPNAQWSDDAPTCTRIQCSPPPPPPANGAINCSRGNNIGSQCTYTCGPDFAVVGPPVTTCRDMGDGDYRFDNPAPVCQLITCQPPFDTLANGGVTCTSTNIVNSECTFTCEPGYELVGAEVLTCNDDSDGDANGQWSDTEPFCRSKFFVNVQELFSKIQLPLDDPCFALSDVPNGEFSCSNGSNANLVCTLQCDRSDGYFVYPPGNGQLTCQPNGTWDIPTPCCGQQCLMHSVFDIIFIMDSSTSIGFQNWVLMKSFVADMISAFDVSDDGTRVAVFRYNRGVDRRSQILFNRFINDKSGLLTAVDNIPYNGSGTWIGRALEYAQNHVLRYRNGNRLVRDVIITITDGRSYDSVLPVSDQLRIQGALTYALGIIPGNGLGPSNRLLLEIAGSMNRVVFSSPELVGIADIFKEKLTNDLCGHPCASQCPPLLPPTNGLMSCTNGNVEDSVCSYSCRPGYALVGEPQTMCVDGPNLSNDGRWTSAAPSCLAQCPNYGIIDLVVVLDSSRSIGLKSWTDMKAFVRSLIGSFEIGPNAVKVSAFRYNRRVDTDTQILLNDNSFFTAYDAIPYNGAGTRTALALQHVRDVILTQANGDRPAARNVVLTVTDGRSVSTIVPISTQLRASGALTYTLGVPPIIGNGMNRLNLLAMAGNPSRRLLANNGDYTGLYEQFSSSLIQEMCSPPLPMP